MEVYQGKRLVIEKVLTRLPGGGTSERIVVRPGDAVAVLPLSGDRCYLIRQYRFAVGEYICEAPAGTMDAGETPEETAHRELIEETGLRAGTLIPKGYIYTTPGYTDEKIHLFEARDLTQSDEYEKDDDEVIEVMEAGVDEVCAMVADGRIRDAKTICLVCRCLMRGA